MGNGNSSAISMNLDRSNLFYFTGETVTGTAGLHVTEGKVEADQIYIELTGEIGYTTTRTVSDGKTTTTHTDYHHVPFYSAKAIFAQPKNGQKQIVYTEGKYSWPFEIPLSTHLPPTINEPQAYPHVRYYLQVVIDKPWYKPNKRETIYLTVFPHVSLLQNPLCLEPTIFGNHNRKDITLRGSLNKTAYVPGELVYIKLEIENPQRVFIKGIDLSMLQSYRIGQNSRGYNIFKITLPNIMNTKEEHIKQEYPVKIPSIILPPTYQFQGGIHRVALVTNQYMLKFVVRAEGFFTNFDIDIPLTLGTDPNPDQNHQHTSSPLIVSYTSSPEESMFTDHDLPPSYESVVQNTKQ